MATRFWPGRGGTGRVRGAGQLGGALYICAGLRYELWCCELRSYYDAGAWRVASWNLGGRGHVGFGDGRALADGWRLLGQAAILPGLQRESSVKARCCRAVAGGAGTICAVRRGGILRNESGLDAGGVSLVEALAGVWVAFGAVSASPRSRRGNAGRRHEFACDREEAQRPAHDNRRSSERARAKRVKIPRVQRAAPEHVSDPFSPYASLNPSAQRDARNSLNNSGFSGFFGRFGSNTNTTIPASRAGALLTREFVVFAGRP